MEKKDHRILSLAVMHWVSVVYLGMMLLFVSACNGDNIFPPTDDASTGQDAESDQDAGVDSGMDEVDEGMDGESGDLDSDEDAGSDTDSGTDTDTVTCSATAFLGECTTTSGCKSLYNTATDCKNSSGGVCFCGAEVCGCLEICTPDCDGKECGDDKCGGSCGDCVEGDSCENGLCVSCTPNCDGKECGDDECGGSCGDCVEGDTCESGLCVSCKPNCDGKECGDNGCNGICGTCAADEYCNDSQQCMLQPEGEGVVTGELRMWHKITITWEGPDTDEKAQTNPFLDYRLQCTFTGPSGQKFVVPGYYAADGVAANTSATSGNKWRCHIAPNEIGTWTYDVSFRSGDNVAVDDNANAGNSAGFMDKDTGSFSVAATNKTGRDLRAKGYLQYVGGHYLQFAGSNEYFLKQGPDAPENLLAYEDFDGDFKSDGINDKRIKSWSAHVKDWKTGDPTWQNTKGKGLIGAINYLASKGLNSFSFIPLNINGDDKNVFPFLNYNERYRMDVSKLDQWEIVFSHGTKKGMFLHFKTLETENELLLDGGNLGVQRKLYYRELIARFGHNLALNWNLGEEINDASTAQKKAWAEYFWKHDPYQHHIVIHNGDNHFDLLGPADNGGSYLTGFSLQTNQPDFSRVHPKVLDYLKRSDNAGKPWAVACDEPGDASHALRPVGDEGNSWEDGRKNGIWGTFLAGGWGNEWYFGYQHANSDLTCEDFRSRDGFWDYARYALEFFKQNEIPYWQMKSDDSLISSSNDYCFYKQNEIYLVYLKNGGQTNLNLSNSSGIFEVKWYDPKNGGNLQNGSVTSVDGNGNRSLGNPPHDTSSDWLVVVRKAN